MKPERVEEVAGRALGDLVEAGANFAVVIVGYGGSEYHIKATPHDAVMHAAQRRLVEMLQGIEDSFCPPEGAEEGDDDADAEGSG